MFNQNELNHFFKKNNGIVTYSKLIEFGLSRRQIKELEDTHIIIRVSKGIYNHRDYLVDMMKVYQLENQKLIYSNETAAYIHDLTDRFPRVYSVTTESGYHLRKSMDLKVYYAKKEVFELGVIEIKNAAGNYVRVYDRERTLCDIIKNKDRIELQVYSEVVQNYFKGKVRMQKLSKYAKELNISDKVMEIVTLLMKP